MINTVIFNALSGKTIILESFHQTKLKLKIYLSRMKSKKSSKDLTQHKIQVKLPYLQKADNQRHLLKQSKIKNNHQFDLSTSNSKLPSYNPEVDRNLKFFFEKPTNKKLLQRLKQLRPVKNTKSAHRQTRKTQAQITSHKLLEHRVKIENRSQNVSRKKQDPVSSEDFLSYLENVRKKILSSSNKEINEDKNKTKERSTVFLKGLV